MTTLRRSESEQIEAVRAEAKRTFLSTATRVRQLTNHAAALASQLEQERDQLKQFVGQFALEQRLLDDNEHVPPTGAALVFDLEALRRDAQRLDESIARAATLRDRLDSARVLLHDSNEALDAPSSAGEASDAHLVRAMNAAREEERRRLAREIHDGPAQILGNTILAIQTAAQFANRHPERVAEDLASVVTLLQDGVAEMRRFMFDLQPSTLQDQGLLPTVRRYVDDFCRFFGKRVSLTFGEDLPDLSAAEQLALFRIVQEALQNVQKHAHTDAAAVQLVTSGDNLCLSIVDAGHGFSADGLLARTGGGAGVPGMRERAKLIGAELTVVSAPDAGTTVTMVLPFRVQGDESVDTETEE